MAENIKFPLQTVKRLMKDARSGDGCDIIGAEIADVMSQLTGLFILYLGSTSNDIAQENNKKTVMLDHVYQALKELGFENYIEKIDLARLAASGENNTNMDLEVEKDDQEATSKRKIEDSAIMVDDDEEEVIDTTVNKDNPANSPMKVAYEDEDEMQY